MTLVIIQLYGGRVRAVRVAPPGRGCAAREVTGTAYSDLVKSTAERRDLLRAQWRCSGESGRTASR